MYRIGEWMGASRARVHVLVEEGMLQHCLSLFERTPSASIVSKLLSHAPLPSVRVIFDLPKEEVLSRLAKRGKGMRAFMGTEYQNRFTEVVFEVHRVILECLTERVVPTLYIRGTKDEERIIVDVCDCISKQ